MPICECFENLTFDNKQKLIQHSLSTCHVIDKSTKTIIVFSNIDEVITLAVNTVRYNIQKGANRICVCTFSILKSAPNLRINTHYLTKLVKIPSVQKNTEVFIAKGWFHDRNCINSQPISLKTLCYFQVFLNYSPITGLVLKRLAEQGTIPKSIAENRLPCYSHFGYFKFNQVFNLWCPALNTTFVSCQQPEKHLHMVPLNRGAYRLNQ